MTKFRYKIDCNPIEMIKFSYKIGRSLRLQLYLIKKIYYIFCKSNCVLYVLNIHIKFYVN